MRFVWRHKSIIMNDNGLLTKLNLMVTHETQLKDPAAFGN